MTLLQKIARAAVVFALVSMSISPAAAWTGPASGPPTCASGSPGCDAPLNVSAATQTKTGNLGLSNGLNVNGRVNVTGPANDWAEVINWAPGSVANSYGILVGATNYSLFQNAAGYYTYLDNSSWGVYTNGNIYIGGAQLINNGDLYMPWAGAWLSTKLTTGGAAGLAFGGGFEMTYYGACYVGNAYTGACSCPGYAPYARYSYYMDTNSTYGGGRGYLCGN